MWLIESHFVLSRAITRGMARVGITIITTMLTLTPSTMWIMWAKILGRRGAAPFSLNSQPARNLPLFQVSCMAVGPIWYEHKRRFRKKWRIGSNNWMISMRRPYTKWSIWRNKNIKYVSNNWTRSWCRPGTPTNVWTHSKSWFSVRNCWPTHRCWRTIRVNLYSSPTFWTVSGN